MKVTVRCRCTPPRTIDVTGVGPSRLRCRGCKDIIWDPARDAPTRAPPPPEPDPEADTDFLQKLLSSAELRVLQSTDGEAGAKKCAVHPDRRVVAACSVCERLLCRACLDQIGETFMCSACVARALERPAPKGLRAFLARIFGSNPRRRRA